MLTGLPFCFSVVLIEQYKCNARRLTSEISSSGCINFDVKPELDSGFLICGAPVIVAPGLADSEVAEEVMAAAEGNVGLGGPLVWEDEGAELDWKIDKHN